MTDDDWKHPIYEWLDDNDPHLSSMTLSELMRDPRTKHYFDAKPAKKTSAGAGARTRKINAEKGITQKNLRGSSKQKKWASEIRGSFIKLYEASHPRSVSLAKNWETASSFWIEKRNSLSDVAHIIESKLKAIDDASVKLDAEFEKAGVAQGQSYTATGELKAALDAQRQAQRDLQRYVS